MDDAGSHHPQQTTIGTENQTLHVLTHEWELNRENTWTQREEQHTPGPAGESGVRRGNLENGSMVQQTTMTHIYLCNKLAHSEHVSHFLIEEIKKNNKK